MRRPGTQLGDAESAEKGRWVSPPAYAMIAKTDRPERPWDVCGLFENLYDASDAAGSLYGVSALVCRLVPISRDGDGQSRLCRVCGEPFEPARYNQVYCRPGCRTEAGVAPRKHGRGRGKRSRARR